MYHTQILPNRSKDQAYEDLKKWASFEAEDSEEYEYLIQTIVRRLEI